MASESQPNTFKGSRQQRINVKFGNARVAGRGTSMSVGGITNNYYGGTKRGLSRSARGGAKPDAVSLYATDPLSWASTLSRISDYDFRREQRRIARQRVEGTAEWIIEDPTVQKWIADEAGSILWFTGKIGSGKSVTCSRFVDYLDELEKTQRYSIIYHSIGSSRHDPNPESYFLRSVLKDVLVILERLELTPLEFKVKADKLFSARASEGVDVDDLKETLLELFQLVPFAYLIVDGLDELGTDSIPSALALFYDLLKTHTDSKILIASRTDLGYNIRVDYKYHISAPDENAFDDIGRYIDHTIQMMTRRKRVLTEDERVLETITVKLRERANGMFLWVKLQLEALWLDCLSDDPETILEALENLPNDLPSIYARCLHRIPPNLASIALRAFSWMGCAFRPLTISECQEALALESDSTPWDGKKRINRHVILSACCNLTSLDTKDHTIQFIHSSVRQYLFNKDDPKPKSFAVLANGYGVYRCGIDCVNYLSFLGFDKTHNQHLSVSKASLPSPASIRSAAATHVVPHTIAKLITTNNKQATLVRLPGTGTITHDTSTLAYAFFAYAKTYWISHTQTWTAEYSTIGLKNNSHIITAFATLAATPRLPKKCYPWAVNDHSPYDHQRGLLRYGLNNAHRPLLGILSATLGSIELLSLYRSKLTEEGFTALHLAARNNFCPAPEFMRICDINAVDEAGWTSLHHAAMRDHTTVALKLTESSNINASIETNDGETALSVAAVSSSEEMISLLLKAGAVHRGYTLQHPLLVAARSGNVKVLERLLLARSQPLDHPYQIFGGFGAPSLLLEIAAQAASFGQVSVLETLIRLHPSYGFTDDFLGKWGILSLAIEAGHRPVVQFCLQVVSDKYSDAFYYNKTLGKTLARILKSGYVDVLEDLWRRRHLLGWNNFSRVYDRSPIVPILIQDHVHALRDIVQYWPANVNHQDLGGISILMRACAFGSLKCVLWLIRHPKVDPTIEDEEGDTVLEYARNSSDHRILELLLIEGSQLHGLSHNPFRTLFSSFELPIIHENRVLDREVLHSWHIIRDKMRMERRVKRAKYTLGITSRSAKVTSERLMAIVAATEDHENHENV